jgi:hypothetical protein
MRIDYNRSIIVPSGGTPPPINASTTATALQPTNAIAKGGMSYSVAQDSIACVVYMATDGYRCAAFDLEAGEEITSFVFDPICDQAPEFTIQGNWPSSNWTCAPYYSNGMLYALTNHGLSNCDTELNDGGVQVTYQSCDSVTWHLWEIDIEGERARELASGKGAAHTPISFDPNGNIYWGTYCTRGSYYQYTRSGILNTFTPDPPDRFYNVGAAFINVKEAANAEN